MPRGSVPKAWPQSPPSRVAQNASATAGAVADEQRAPAARAPSARRAGGRAPRSASRSRARRAARRRTRRAAASAPAASRPRRGTPRASPGCAPSARSTSRQMTLPEPSQIELQRRLAVEPRHARLLDVAVAAEALERLGRVARRRACRPSTWRPRWRCGANALALVPAVVGAARAASPVTVAASDSTPRSASTFCISGWSTSEPAERRAVRRVVHRLRDGRAHRPPAEPSTQSSRVWLTISMIVGTPRPSSPTQPRPGARRTRPRSRRSTGCRACPSAAGCGSGCACRPAARAGAGSTRARRAPARARGTRRTSAPSRTTCGR